MVIGPRHLFAAALAVASFSVVSTTASADDPPFVPWTKLLPSLQYAYTPNSANLCNRGHPLCVDAVIGEMQRRFKPLARTCDHAAVFSLAYLRTTKEFQRAAATPGFFEETPFVIHEDAVFASLYFQAWDSWHHGQKAKTPQAWATAFTAASQRSVSASGDLLLGMNAHVNRDLPFALAKIGLVKPDGSSRKRDHDQVDVFLNRVVEPLYVEIADRFDPTIDDGNLQGTKLDDTAFFQLLAAWREAAWRHAEQLVAAKSSASRNAVEQEIEDYAAGQADLIVQATGYGPLTGDTATRDRYCAANHG